jgi:hypothetical protein
MDNIREREHFVWMDQMYSKIIKISYLSLVK